MKQGTVRPAAVEGQFYPRDPATLAKRVDEFIDASRLTSAPDRVRVIVSPHAGYPYSGATAGHAFARVRGKRPARVVLLGCSHRHQFSQASIFPSGSFSTPLGRFPIDEAFSARLAHIAGAAAIEPHLGEHALEVQLPFLSRAVGIVPIVPVLFGSPASHWHAAIGEALAQMLDPSDLVVCSTDLSHYLADAAAREIDRRSIDAVLSKDWTIYIHGIRAGSCSMCGAAAMVAAMSCATALNTDSWLLLDYRTSAFASHDDRSVVGYAAMSMEHAA